MGVLCVAVVVVCAAVVCRRWRRPEHAAQVGRSEHYLRQNAADITEIKVYFRDTCSPRLLFLPVFQWKKERDSAKQFYNEIHLLIKVLLALHLEWTVNQNQRSTQRPQLWNVIKKLSQQSTSSTEATNSARDSLIKFAAECVTNRKWEAAVSGYFKFIWWSIAATEIAPRLTW